MLMNKNLVLKLRQTLCLVLLSACSAAVSGCADDNDDWIDEIELLENESIIEWEGNVYKIRQEKLVREDLKGKGGEFTNVRGWLNYNDSTRTWSMSTHNNDLIDYPYSWTPRLVVTDFADESLKNMGGKLFSGSYVYDYSIENIVQYIGSRLSFSPGTDYYRVVITGAEDVTE